MTKNRICDLAGISHPIVMAAMGWICGPKLVAAVSNAGALGTLGLNSGLKRPIMDPEAAKEHQRGEIAALRKLTKKPFALSIVLGRPMHEPFTEKWVELAVEEKVPVVIVAGGSADRHTAKLKNGGVKVFHCLSSVKQARQAEAAGVDAIIAEGYEGGGHSGLEQIPTFVLAPQVADAVKIPVIAGGGVADARGYAAAMALGAEGVYVGTRFIATHECDAHDNVKKAIVAAHDDGTISLPSGYAMLRSLRNEYTEKYEALIRRGAPETEIKAFQVLTDSAGHEVTRYIAGLVDGDLKEGWLASGIASGMIKEILSAEEVIRSMVKGAPAVLRQATEKLG